jgi:hypothetical protein
VSQYEGLNLPQLLELMHGLREPDPVSWVPETPGWWILLAWILAVVILCVRQVVLRRRANRYRRRAEKALGEISASAAADPAAAAISISTLLKHTALIAYPRAEVASLHGDAWSSFLCESSNNDPSVVRAAGLFAQAAYRPDADGNELVAPARRWIRVHRA